MMKKYIFLIIIAILQVNVLYSQTAETDSLSSIKLEEVVVRSKPLVSYTKASKPLSTLDEYLGNSQKVSIIRRGGYAWEPMLNSMSTERLSVTIDGMHIFGACTDKMDPVTSYVEVSNLSEINVQSGQDGAAYGPTIGGGIDLVRNKHSFCQPGWSGAIDLGYESNSNMFAGATRIKYAHHKFYIATDFMYRDAGNYKAGKRTPVPFSQFTKYNASMMVGAKLNEKNTLSGSFIFDNANNVGYPALPMDVSLARAYIASVEHTAEQISDNIEEWTTKVYFNTIKHKMDDTKRPEVPIHMDMPGWSTTYGFLSKVKAAAKKQVINLNVNLYYNIAKAEMTMYPKDTTEKPMFMLTWPDVRTLFAGVNMNNRWMIATHHSLSYLAGLGYHRNDIASAFGLSSVQIFHPNTPAAKNRFLYNVGVGYNFLKDKWDFTFGAAYGERAPSVSEGYGFYLFNSFDKYDYIGNPSLKNEKSFEVNTDLKYKIAKLKLNWSASYFHIFNYILGVQNTAYAPMTIGAAGVREYKGLKSADLFSTEVGIEYRPHPSWNTKMSLSYHFGQDFLKQSLPLVRPFSFKTSVGYKIKALDLELTIEGSTKQYAFSKTYGESMTKAWAILNFSCGYQVNIQQQRLYIKAGIENIADTYYSTYSDWNHIPRKGRNFFVNVSFLFQNKQKE